MYHRLSRTSTALVLSATVAIALSACDSELSTTPAGESPELRRDVAVQASPPAPTASVAATVPVTFYACYTPSSGGVYRIKVPGLPTACVSSAHVAFSWTDGAGAASDHGALTGLLNDDHPQYLLTSGSRPLTGSLSMGGNTLTGLAAATSLGDAVRYEQAVKTGDPASGDLSGAYPGPTVAQLQGTAVAATAPATGQVLTYNGSAWAPAAAGGGVSGWQIASATNAGALQGCSFNFCYSYHAVSVDCPAGKLPVGGGFSGGFGDSPVVTSKPNASNGWEILIAVRSGLVISANSVTVYVICLSGVP